MKENKEIKIEEFPVNPNDFIPFLNKRLNSLSDCNLVINFVMTNRNQINILGLHSYELFNHLEHLIKPCINSFFNQKDYEEFEKSLKTYNDLFFFLQPLHLGSLYSLKGPIGFYTDCISVWKSVFNTGYNRSHNFRIPIIQVLITSFEEFLNRCGSCEKKDEFLNSLILIARMRVEYLDGNFGNYLLLLSKMRKKTSHFTIEKEDEDFIDQYLPDYLKTISNEEEKRNTLLELSLLNPDSKTVKIFQNEAPKEILNEIKKNTDLIPEIKASLHQVIQNFEKIKDSYVSDLTSALKENNEILIEKISAKIADDLSQSLRKDNILLEQAKSIDLKSKISGAELLDKVSIDDLAIAEYLVEKFGNSSISILQICKVLEREILKNIFNPLKEKIHSDKTIEKPQEYNYLEYQLHQSYKILYKFIFDDGILTLANFGRLIGFAESNMRIKLFKLLFEFIIQHYPTNHHDIVKLIKKTTNDKNYQSISISELRNYCAHPKDLILKNINEILSKDQYFKVREFLFYPETQLLIKLVKYRKS